LNYSKLRNKKQTRKPIKLSLRGKKQSDENYDYGDNQESAFEKGEEGKRRIRKIINKKSARDNDQMQIDEVNSNSNSNSNSNIKDSKRKESMTITSEAEDDKNFNKSNKTVIIKNISPITKEEDLEGYIKEFLPETHIQDIRVVRDRKGNSKGFAFVDFFTVEDAHDCAILLNNKIIEENIISCAVSKPPKLG
jgi:RNA recognition motif-containing protein